MKRAIIIYAVLFLITLIIPALVCFSGKQTQNNELVNIFQGLISLIECYH